MANLVYNDRPKVAKEEFGGAETVEVLNGYASQILDGLFLGKLPPYLPVVVPTKKTLAQTSELLTGGILGVRNPN